MRCERMELGEPDASGRRRPVAVPGSEFEFECDMVVFAIGTNANPILGQTSGLKLDKRGYIATDETWPPRSPASMPAATSSPAPPP
jgi:glutamate synthase (NADPH/NADH) small chain